MIATIIFIALLVFAAGYFNGTMDWIKLNDLDKEGWRVKWKWFPVFKNGDGYTTSRDPYKNKWYYFGLFAPEFKERFPYSSTILVFLTDEWHSNKWRMFLCYEGALSSVVVCYEGLQWWWIPIGVIILKTIRGLGFTLKYDKK